MKIRALFWAWICCTGLILILAHMRTVRAHAAQANSSASDEDEGAAGPKFSAEAASIFGKRCTACHTYGKGVKVGPDLKGVTERRTKDWLHHFIHASSKVIASGDPTAIALFAQFKQQRMPDWIDLSDQQIDDILYYISIGGPDIKPLDEHNAATATATDMEKGRQLFYGEARLKHGAQACATCHALQGSGLLGGSLGPDLTHVYLRYQDQALTAFLRQPCFQWDVGATAGTYLTPRESFDLKSFLRQSAMAQAKSPAGTAAGGAR